MKKKATKPKSKKPARTVKPRTKPKASKTKAASKKSSDRIGILGGAFNPVHVGHLNAALTVKQALNLDRVLLVPMNKAPHRDLSGPTPEERFELVKMAAEPYSPELEASDVEIQRGGISFTVDTLKEFGRTHSPENIYFIMGADAYKHFQTWRDFPELLKLSNFVVTTRPGSTVSLFEEDCDPALQNFIKQTDGKKIQLKSKRQIIKVELEDISVSSTDVRKRLRSGGDARTFVPPKVLEHIHTRGYYKRSVPAIRDYRAFALFCAQAAMDRKALSLKIYDMSRTSSYVDYSIICSATSTKHSSSVAQNITEKVKEEFGVQPISLEGTQEGQWVLIDYGSVVIHVFEDSTRAHYKIEELWKNSTLIPVENIKN